MRNLIAAIVGVPLLAVGLMTCLCVGCIVFGAIGIGQFAFEVFGAVPEATDAFLGALSSSDYDRAYNQASSEYQAALGSAGVLRDAILEYNLRPTRWNINNININNDRGRVSGSAAFDGGRSGDFEVRLRQSGETWQVDGVTLDGRAIP
ncbi:MAG: hypothetical protein GYB67_07410 [Chloroflexi bacterium]|nr:hypothetical protein [Chloroflexota bacterium]